MKKYLNYGAFERSVAWLVTAGMAVVIVLAMIHFARGLYEAIIGVVPGWDYSAFQILFDRVLTVVIALELSRSVLQMAQGEHGLAQVRTVVLIGILAVVRKLILLEVDNTSGMFLLGIAAATLALGLVYALVLEAERRARKQDLGEAAD
ncbi:phosphate-starvation-inducible PsiE family protein [Maricaulaceae bacterium MS644]